MKREKKKSNKEGKGKYEIEDKNMFEATLKGQNGESRNAVTNQIARLVVPCKNKCMKREITKIRKNEGLSAFLAVK